MNRQNIRGRYYLRNGAAGDTVEPRLMSIPLAAESLGIGLTRMRELVNAGKVESVYIFSRRLVVTSSLDSFVEHLRRGEA